MNTIGIIRRIDDLGRIVIPKEIRQQLKIREGDPLELFANKDGSVLLKPYQETSRKRKVEDLIELFKQMDRKDQKEMVKKLVEEMG